MTDEEIPEEFATLFVTNLPDDEDAIRSEFSKYGEVSSIRLLPRKEDQDTRAGIIAMSTGIAAREVMDKLRGSPLEPGGKRLRLNWDTRALERFRNNAGRGGGKSGGGFGVSNGPNGGFGKISQAHTFTPAVTPLDVQPNQSSPARSAEAIKVGGQEYVPVRITMYGKETVAGYVLASFYSALGSFPEAVKPSDFTASHPLPEENLSRFGNSAKRDSIHPSESSIHRSDSGVDLTNVSPVAVQQPSVVESPAQSQVEPLKFDDEIPNFAGVMRRRLNRYGVATSTEDPANTSGSQAVVPSSAAPKKLSLRSLSAFTSGVLVHPKKGNMVKEREGFSVCIRHIFLNFEVAVWSVDKSQELASTSPAALVKSMSRRLKDFYEGFDATQYPVEPNQMVAVFVDHFWYRAQCVAEISATDLLVFLVDQGVEREVKQDSTFPLDEQFGVEPVAATVVTLSDLPLLQDHPSLLEDLKDLLLQEKHSSQSPTTCEAAEAVLISAAPDYRIKLCIEDVPLKTVLLARRFQQKGLPVRIGYMLNASDAANIFMVDADKREALEALQQDVHKKLELSNVPPESIEPNAAVGVFYQKEWYRGYVDGKQRGLCMGTLIDFGDRFTVPIPEVKGLPKDVVNIDPVTDLSSLKNVNAQLLTDPRIGEQVKQMVGQYWVYQEFGRDPEFALSNFIHLWNADGQLVPLEMPPLPIESASVIVDENYSFHLSQLKYEHAFKVGDQVPVAVQLVSDPEFFFLLYGKDLESDERMRQLAKDLESAGRDAPKLIDMPAEGALVCGRYSADNAWYRAAITGYSSLGKARVTYIDYGNEEELALDDIRSMTPLLMTYPRMVFQAALGNIQPLRGDQFAEEEIQRANDMFNGQSGVFKVMQNDDNSLICGVLRMDNENRSAADLMASAGIIQKMK